MRPRLALTIAAPAALAIALTAFQLSSRSLWLDEGATVAIASAHGGALWRGIAHDGGNMLVYYLLLHGVIALFGDTAAVIRLPSVISTGLTAALVAGLALRLFDGDRRVASTAATLTAVSLPVVFWGQDARGYAPLLMLSTASFLAFAAILQAPASGRAPVLPLLGYGASLLLALYVGFDAVLVVPSQLLLLLGRRHRRHAGAVIAVLAAVAVLCVPLLVLAVNRGSSQLFWVPGPGLPVLGQALAVFTSAGMPPNFHATLLTVVTAALSVLAGGRAVGLALRARPVAWQLSLLVAWLVVPTVLGLAGWLAGEPLELPRLAILMIPTLSLMLAWGLWRTRLPIGLAWAGAVALLGLRLAALAPSYGTSPENWKAAARYILATTPAVACIAFYPQDGRMPFDYYVLGDRGSARLTPVLPATPWRVVAPFVEDYRVLSRTALASVSAHCPRLWLVASHEGQRNGPPQSRRNAARYRSLLAGLREHYSQEELRTFGYAAQVRVVLLRR